MNVITRLNVTTSTMMVEVGGFGTQRHNTTPHGMAKGFNYASAKLMMQQRVRQTNQNIKETELIGITNQV